MTPQELDAYLVVLRKHGVMQACIGTVSVVFGPDSAPLPAGEDLTPGSWKGPVHLDADFQSESRLP